MSVLSSGDEVEHPVELTFFCTSCRAVLLEHCMRNKEIVQQKTVTNMSI